MKQIDVLIVTIEMVKTVLTPILDSSNSKSYEPETNSTSSNTPSSKVYFVCNNYKNWRHLESAWVILPLVNLISLNPKIKWYQGAMYKF